MNHNESPQLEKKHNSNHYGHHSINFSWPLSNIINQIINSY